MNQIDSMLEKLVDKRRSARAEQEGQICYDAPQYCDLCGGALLHQQFFVDGEVKDTPQTPIPGHRSVGQWAYMCGACFGTRGVGIAWGTGQLYRRDAKGLWIMVAGFPPEESSDP